MDVVEFLTEHDLLVGHRRVAQAQKCQPGTQMKVKEGGEMGLEGRLRRTRQTYRNEVTAALDEEFGKPYSERVMQHQCHVRLRLCRPYEPFELLGKKMVID